MIIKVRINEETCTACGICQETCPEVFEVNDVAVVKEDADFNAFEDEIKEAADECPDEAIEVEED